MWMGKFFVFTVIIGGILTFAGLNEMRLALQSRTQVEMSVAEFIRARPASRWVKLTGCRVGYGGMVYAETIRRGASTLSDVSVPVFPDNNVNQRVAVVLCVADKRERAVVSTFRMMGMPTETIEGVVRNGSMSKKLQALAPWKLADRYVIIDEGRKPSLKNAGIMLGLGMALLAWFGLTMKRRFTRSAAREQN